MSAAAGFVLVSVLVAIAVLSVLVLIGMRDSSMGVATTRMAQQSQVADYVAEAGLRHARWQADTSSCANYALPATAFGDHVYSASYTPDTGSPVDITVSAKTAAGLTRSATHLGQTVYQGPTSLVIQPGPDLGKDTHVYQWKPTWNFGSDPNLVVSAWDSSAERSLLKFDLSAVPGHARVLSARLELHSNSNAWDATTIDVYRVTRDWEEGTSNGGTGAGANWTEAAAASSWTTPGGDMAATVVARSQVAASVGWESWDVTPLVQQWVAGAAPNHGLALRTDEYNKGAQFDSSDATAAANRPRLVISYACECGRACVVGACTGATFGDDFAASSYSNSTGTGAWLGDWQEADSAGASPFAGKIQIVSGELRLQGTPVDANDPGVHRGVDLSGYQSATLSFDFRTGPGVEAAEDSVVVEVSADGGTLWTVLEDFVNAGPSASGARSYDISAHMSGTTRVRLRVNAAYGGPDEYFYVDNLLITASCDPPAPTSCSADYLADTKISEYDTLPYGSGTQKDLAFMPEGSVFNGVTVPAGGAWLSVDATDDLFYLNDTAGGLLTTSPGSASMGGLAWITTGTYADHAAIVDFGSDTLRYYDGSGAYVGGFSLSGYMVGTPSGATFIEQTVSGIYDGHLAITDRGKKVVYITDQNGILKVTLDMSVYANGLTDVAHIPGTDKLLVLDESRMAYILGFDGSRLGEYSVAGFGTAGTVGLAIDPLTCDHVIGDDGVDKVIRLNTSTPPGGGGGGGGPSPPPGPVPMVLSADTDIRGGDSSNYGSSVGLRAGRDNGGPVLYSLLRFDVSGIPSGAPITRATLRLYQFASNRSGSFNLAAHRIDEAWTESGASWTSSDGTQGWAAGVGGTFTFTPVSSTAITIGGYGWYEWDITPLVQEWVDGVSPNHGVQMIYESVRAGYNVTFASKEYGDASLRPQLVVEF